MHAQARLENGIWLRHRLRDALLADLPGVDAQSLMSPRPRHGWVPGEIPPGLREAAALLLLYEREGVPHLVLTQRREGLAAHPGQISLPGGAIDEGEDPPAAALREANEEIGVDPSRIAVVGSLTPLHIPASGYLLHPVVATTEVLGPLVISDAEVARTLEVAVADLACPACWRLEEWTLRGNPTQVPSFQVQELAVWGATAMVLAEFLALFGCPPDPWSTATDPAGGNLSAD